MSFTEKESSSVDNLGQTISRALSIIECLGRSGAGQLSEIASAVGVHKSTVYRMLALLIRKGYVYQDPATKTYRLTLRLFELGCQVMAPTGIRERALPIMNELMHRTRETIWLSALDGTDLVYLEKIDSPEVIRVTCPVGTRMPLYVTAAGKAMLSTFWPARWEELLVPTEGYPLNLPQRTDRTITSTWKLREDLLETALRGYAVDDGELTPGVRAIAAPVRDLQGGAVAALSAASFASRLPLDRVQEIGQLLVAAARQLESIVYGRVEEHSTAGRAPSAHSLASGGT